MTFFRGLGTWWYHWEKSGNHKDIWRSREEMHSVSLKMMIPHIGISSITRSVMSNSLGPHGKESMGFSRQEYWSGLPFPFQEDLPDPGIESGESPALQADSLLSELQRVPICISIFLSFWLTSLWQSSRSTYITANAPVSFLLMAG